MFRCEINGYKCLDTTVIWDLVGKRSVKTFRFLVYIFRRRINTTIHIEIDVYGLNLVMVECRNVIKSSAFC